MEQFERKRLQLLYYFSPFESTARGGFFCRTVFNLMLKKSLKIAECLNELQKITDFFDTFVLQKLFNLFAQFLPKVLAIFISSAICQSTFSPFPLM